MEDKNMILENKTICDEAVMKEMAKPLNARYFKYILLFDVVVLFVAQIPMLSGRYLEGCCGIALVIFMSVVAFYKGSTVEKSAMKNIRLKYQADYYEATAIIDDEKMTYRTSIYERELYHKNIKSIRETDKLFIIEYKKDGMLPLAKDGFLRGNAEQFHERFGKYL